MRAHSNYIETAPFVLILIGLIEMTGTSSTSPTWLWIVGGIYLLGRIAHGIGMDDGKFGKGRTIGTIITLLTLLGLAIYAILIPYLTLQQPDVTGSARGVDWLGLERQLEH